jgi:hypothetical protein
MEGVISLLCGGHGCVGERNGKKGRWCCWRKCDLGNCGAGKRIRHEIVMAWKMMKGGIEFGKERKVALLAR